MLNAGVSCLYGYYPLRCRLKRGAGKCTQHTAVISRGMTDCFSRLCVARPAAAAQAECHPREAAGETSSWQCQRRSERRSEGAHDRVSSAVMRTCTLLDFTLTEVTVTIERARKRVCHITTASKHSGHSYVYTRHIREIT